MKILRYVFFLIFFHSSAWAKPVFFLEDIDSSRFPLIELSLRENFHYPISSSNLVVAEELDGIRTIPRDLEIFREPGEEPIQLVVSVQPTDSKSLNQWTTNLVISMSTLVGAQDKYSIHIQEDKRFLFLKNQTTESLQSGLILPTIDTYSRTLESISVLLDKLAVTKYKPPFLLIILHSQSVPDKDKLVDVSKKARRMGIPIHILGFESREAQKLAEYSDGKFYSLRDKNSTRLLFEDIQYFKKPPYRIRYQSRNEISFLEEKKVFINLGVLNLQNLSADYTVNIRSRFKNTIEDPFVFIPTAVFILLVCGSALFLLNQIRLPKKKNGSGYHPHFQSTTDQGIEEAEANIYQQMYGRMESVEDDDYTLIGSAGSIPAREKGSDLYQNLSGESYQKAVLIQREGPNPGKQFNIHSHQIMIGRSETCDLVLWDNSVSPTHARIRNVRNHFVLYDLLSQSGVFLNGRKLLRPKVLHDFDEIQLGKSILIFRGK